MQPNLQFPHLFTHFEPRCTICNLGILPDTDQIKAIAIIVTILDQNCPVILTNNIIFETLPYTIQGLHADTLATRIVARAEASPEFRSKLPSQFVQVTSALVKAPDDNIRNAVLKVMLAADPAAYPDELITEIVAILDVFTENYRTAQNALTLIAWLASKGKVDIERVSAACLQILTTKVGDYLTEHKDITREYFWGGLCLTGVF
jgi:hypothetical protein